MGVFIIRGLHFEVYVGGPLALENSLALESRRSRRESPTWGRHLAVPPDLGSGS